MKTYRRKSMKNKTKKNKRRYKLKGGMGPGWVDRPSERCPRCRINFVECYEGNAEYTGNKMKCKCTVCSWSGPYQNVREGKE